MPKSRGRKKPKGLNPQIKKAMLPAVTQAIEGQLEAFRKKFGRDPQPGEPVFFDPDKDEPVEAAPASDEEIVAAFIAMGAGPEHVFAYRRTGLLGLDHTLGAWPAGARKEWEAAVAEYFRLEGKAGRN